MRFTATIFLSFLLFTNAFSLQAPYLLGITQDSSNGNAVLKISWRNNSFDYDSVYILRKDIITDTFSRIAVIIGSSTCFEDSSLSYSHLYYYALIAKSSSEFSDTSNVDSARTSARDTAIYDKLSIVWNCHSKTAQIIYADQNCKDKVLKITRFGIGGSPITIKDTIFSDQANCNLSLTDEPGVLNRWYIYKALVKTDKLEYTTSDTIYALDPNTFFQQDSQKIVSTEVFSEYPVYSDDLKLWAYKSGDSIFIKENNTPDSICTIIDVKNTENPVFKKYFSYQSPCGQPATAKLFNNVLYYGNSFYKLTNSNFSRNPCSLSIPLTYSFYNFLNDSIFFFTGRATEASISMITLFNFSDPYDTIAFLYIGNSAVYVAGHLATSTIYGPYHDLIWQSSEQGSLTSRSTHVTMLQVIDKNILINSIDSAYIGAPPKLYGGYPSDDILFAKSAFSFLDTVSKTAYLVSNDKLTICGYTLNKNDIIGVKKHYSATEKRLNYISLSHNDNYLYIHTTSASLKNVSIFDCRGRTIGNFNVGNNKRISIPVQNVSRGLYIVKCKTLGENVITKTFIK